MSGKKKKPKKDEAKKPKVNEQLEGFNINIDSFGEIQNTFDIDKINAFLNKNVEDKKLKDRDGIMDNEGFFKTELEGRPEMDIKKEEAAEARKERRLDGQAEDDDDEQDDDGQATNGDEDDDKLKEPPNTDIFDDV